MNTLISIFAFIFLAYSQTYIKAAAFLRLGQGAENIALGNGAATKLTSASFYYNPSIYSELKTDLFSANVSLLSLDRRVYSISYERFARKNIFFGFAWVYNTVNELHTFDDEGVKGLAIDFSDQAFFLTAGYKLSDFTAFAINVKVIRETIDANLSTNYLAKAVALDLSYMHRFASDFSIAINIKDLSKPFIGNSEKIFDQKTHEEIIPKRFIISLQKKIETDFAKNFNIYTDIETIESSADLKRIVHLGLEWNYLEEIAFYFGYLNDKNSANFNFGLSYKFENPFSNIIVAYAYQGDKFGEGASHIISWQLGLTK